MDPDNQLDPTKKMIGINSTIANLHVYNQYMDTDQSLMDPDNHSKIKIRIQLNSIVIHSIIANSYVSCQSKSGSGSMLQQSYGSWNQFKNKDPDPTEKW